jgi:hypothetical protein
MTRSLILLAVCALLAGCGGGDDDGGSGGGGTSKEDFIAQANEICAEGEKKISEIDPADAASAGSPEEVRRKVAETLEKTADEYQPYLDRLRDLDPPDDLAESWSSFLDGVERAFDKIPELADATRENDAAKLQSLSEEFTQIARDTRPFAEDNRLQDCLADSGGQ